MATLYKKINIYNYTLAKFQLFVGLYGEQQLTLQVYSFMETPRRRT